MRYSLFTLAFLPVMAFSVAAFAQAPSVPYFPIARDGEVIDSVGSGAIDDILPVVQVSDGINYITGGVSDEELTYIKEQEKNFNVRLLVRAFGSGAYLSGLTVRFFDAKNTEILTVEGAGPYLYANLPVGVYNVEIVSAKGKVQKLKIKAVAKPKDKFYVTFK